ncbi:hypothetical protein V8C86DRAFT_2970555 [Haematococcus lacustris]
MVSFLPLPGLLSLLASHCSLIMVCCRLLRKLGDISRLLDTFAAAVLPMLHIAGLVFVIFFGFAFLGVLLFGEVPHGEALNSHANFESWPMAMLLLLRWVSKGKQGQLHLTTAAMLASDAM